MKKKEYIKPEIEEVGLLIEQSLLNISDGGGIDPNPDDNVD